MPLAFHKFVDEIPLIEVDSLNQQRGDLLARTTILQELVGCLQPSLKNIYIKPIDAGGVNAITPIVEDDPFVVATQRIAGMGKARR